MDRPYCKIFLDGPTESGPLRDLLAELTAGTVRQRTVQTQAAGGLLIDLFTPGRPARAVASTAASSVTALADDYLNWPAYLEIEACAGAATEQIPVFIAEVARLMHGLRTHGLRTVAACDFEADLDAAVQALAR